MLLQEEVNVEEPKAKRKRIEEVETSNQSSIQCSGSSSKPKNYGANNAVMPRRIETGFFSKVPPELFHHILKFLSSEVTSLPWFYGFCFSIFFLDREKSFNCDLLCACLESLLGVID